MTGVKKMSEKWLEWKQALVGGDTGSKHSSGGGEEGERKQLASMMFQSQVRGIVTVGF